MKQLLLFFLFIFLSVSVFSQVQGPPPPCGYTTAYVCDNDGDGFGLIDLTQAFPFSTFCRVDKGNPEDYYPITYYESQTDMDNEINSIANPDAYTNISNPQTIYYRVNKIVPDNIVYLTAENIIETKRLSTSIPSLEICDDDQDGFATFDLTSVNVFCGVSPSNYTIEYYETLEDANAQINQIANSSNYISDSKTIFVRVEDLDTNIVEVNSFYLSVSEISINVISYLLTCDNDVDGFAEFDLSSKDSEIVNGQIGVEVAYFEDSSLTVQIDKNTPYRNNTNPQTIYVRVENELGCFEDSSFSIEVNPSALSSLDLYMRDSNYSGFSTFDLTSVDIFCSPNTQSDDFNVTYHLSKNDAELGINSISNIINFENTSNPQTLHIRAEHVITSNVEVKPLILSVEVLSAVANNTSHKLCLETSILDLSQFNSSVLGSQDPDGFTLTYYNSQNDAEMEVNPLPQFVDTIDFDTLLALNTVGYNSYFVRVEENIYHSYDISEVYVERSIMPVANDPTPLEICDDETIDGFTTFDLNSKTLEIINGQEETTIVYFLTLEAAENYPLSENILGINSSGVGMSDFINTIPNTQTIYAIVEDINLVCISNIVALDLIVKDCTNLGVIEVNAFHDTDTNGTFETNENLFANGVFTYEANNDGIQRQVSSSTGSFTIISDDDTNTYDINYSLLDDYRDCYEVSTTSFEDVSATNGDKVIYNFPIISENTCNDIAVYLVSYAPPRPGFDYLNRLVIQNKGITPVASGTVEFVHDASVTFNNVSGVDAGNIVTNTATGFTLDFVNLQPNQQETVLINMNVPVLTSLGTLLTNTATYSVTDLSVENNTSALSEIVIGSYDPNDIAESHGPDIFYDNFETTDYLYYTVRFQNVGTADAINVSIDNTLDSRLDKSTIVMLSSSHYNVFTRIDDQLNWKFDNIHLPSEDMDEPNSHGYVYYKIKPLAGYSVGDIIPNTAEIYFDINPAVVTNTFNTEFIETLSNKESNNADFSISPNPAKNLVKLRFNKNTNNSIAIRVLDIQGKLVFKSKNQLKNSITEIDVSHLKSGLYFLKVNDDTNQLTKKLIVN